MAQNFRSSHFEASNPNPINPSESSHLVQEQLTCNDESERGLITEQRHIINRRDGVLWSFLYGNFRPRRRANRRADDQHYLLFDWHEPRILYLALGVLLLSCTDALFTLNLLKAGASEANVIMALMLEVGVDRFVISKISLTSFSLIILVAAARRKFFRSFSVEHFLQVLFAGYLLVICYELYLFMYVFNLDLY